MQNTVLSLPQHSSFSAQLSIKNLQVMKSGVSTDSYMSI